MATTATLSCESRRGSPAPLLLFLLAVLALAAVVYGTHAVQRHGAEAELVRQCLEHNGPAQIWLNPDTGRKAHVCEIQPGLWGIQIISDAGKEITSFVKGKCHRFEQVVQYLLNRGYALH